ncbi:MULTISPECIES: hypothetical protein [unclassified Microcoleus]|uniref:hypothetical protein n=1 Tax=unclassified Microcoleus TaxID=2642155 RepID=UPI002FD4B915
MNFVVLIAGKAVAFFVRNGITFLTFKKIFRSRERILFWHQLYISTFGLPA